MLNSYNWQLQALQGNQPHDDARSHRLPPDESGQHNIERARQFQRSSNRPQTTFSMRSACEAATIGNFKQCNAINRMTMHDHIVCQLASLDLQKLDSSPGKPEKPHWAWAPEPVAAAVTGTFSTVEVTPWSPMTGTWSGGLQLRWAVASAGTGGSAAFTPTAGSVVAVEAREESNPALRGGLWPFGGQNGGLWPFGGLSSTGGWAPHPPLPLHPPRPGLSSLSPTSTFPLGQNVIVYHLESSLGQLHCAPVCSGIW